MHMETRGIADTASLTHTQQTGLMLERYIISSSSNSSLCFRSDQMIGSRALVQFPGALQARGMCLPSRSPKKSTW